MSVVPIINVYSVIDMPYPEFEKALDGYWKVNIPMFSDVDFKDKIQHNISVLPAANGFINCLWAKVNSEYRRRKAISSRDPKLIDLACKRDYLDRLAYSIKLAYEASSRMITIYLDERRSVPLPGDDDEDMA